MVDYLLDNVWFIDVKDVNIEKFVVIVLNFYGYVIFKWCRNKIIL